MGGWFRKEIRSLADMKGLKFRVVGSPIFNDTFTALGANPTQMTWADAQPALASGAVEGQENPLHIFMAAKLHTLGQNHLTLWGYMTDPLIFVVNKQVWANWTEADRKAVRAAAEQAGAENLIAARQGISPGDDAALKAIEKSGVTITQLTPEQRKAFKDATRPVFDKWAATIGKDLVKKAETAIAAAK